MSLYDRWHLTWADLDLPPPPATVLEDLLARYSEAFRAYHTTQHLDECFQHFSVASHLSHRPGEVQVALWFHDAIYDTRSPQNEERSAAWAAQVLGAAGASEEVQSRVTELVLSTRHNAEPISEDARLTVDIDLSILGTPGARFDQYEAQVRQEYSWVPDAIFRQARAKIIREFLARPYVYATSFFRERLEERARLNLQRSLGQLGA